MGMGNAPMSEFIAQTIETKPDSRQNNAMAVYIEECLKQSGSAAGDRRTAITMRMNCERLVKSNARAVLMQAVSPLKERTKRSRVSCVQRRGLPGRKIVFFISDGFLSTGGPLGNSLSNKLRQITDAAQRANVAIYSIDARGLISARSMQRTTLCLMQMAAWQVLHPTRFSPLRIRSTPSRKIRAAARYAIRITSIAGSENVLDDVELLCRRVAAGCGRGERE